MLFIWNKIPEPPKQKYLPAAEQPSDHALTVLEAVLFRGLPLRFLQLLAFHWFSALGISTEIDRTWRREKACFRRVY